eukprot:gene7860-682_t
MCSNLSNRGKATVVETSSQGVLVRSYGDSVTEVSPRWIFTIVVPNGIREHAENQH